MKIVTLRMLTIQSRRAAVARGEFFGAVRQWHGIAQGDDLPVDDMALVKSIGFPSAPSVISLQAEFSPQTDFTEFAFSSRRRRSTSWR